MFEITVKGGNQKIKVKVRINLNGIFGITFSHPGREHMNEKEILKNAEKET